MDDVYPIKLGIAQPILFLESPQNLQVFQAFFILLLLRL